MNEESSVRRESGFRKNARGTQLGLFDRTASDSSTDDKKASAESPSRIVTIDFGDDDEQDKDTK